MRQWARKFGQQFANRIRRRLPRTGDKWHLDEVVLKQQSGKFAPADTPTRAANEAVQIGRPGAAVPFSPRSDQQPVPSPPRSRHCCRAQSFQDPNIPGLGRNLQCGLAINSDFCLARDMNTADPMLQVDGAPPSSSALRSCGRSVVGLPKPKMHVFCLHLVDLFLAKTAWIPDPNSGPSGRGSGFLEAKTPNYGCDPI